MSKNVDKKRLTFIPSYVIIKLTNKERKIKINKKINATQKWLPYEEILEDGIIKLKNHFFIKVIEIKPINYNLKSDLEKEAVFNSYKTFLKTCNFDIQIIVQSNKEDLSKNISKIKNSLNQENEKLQLIANTYIEYLKNLNQKKESTKKSFYIVIKNSSIKKQINSNEKNIINELNENYYKIKESLIRCGNDVINIENKEKIIEILKTFTNIK